MRVAASAALSEMGTSRLPGVVLAWNNCFAARDQARRIRKVPGRNPLTLSRPSRSLLLYLAQNVRLLRPSLGRGVVQSPVAGLLLGSLSCLLPFSSPPSQWGTWMPNAPKVIRNRHATTLGRVPPQCCNDRWHPPPPQHPHSSSVYLRFMTSLVLGSRRVNESPKKTRRGNTNGSEDGVSTAVIAQRQTSPICQAPKHVFHRVALLRQSDSVDCWMTAFGTCRDTRPDCAWCERITEPGGIVSFLCWQLFGEMP